MTDYTDDDRLDFLDALDASDITPSEWEIGFLDTIMTIGRETFTEKQRVVIDKMIEQYSGRVQW